MKEKRATDPGLAAVLQFTPKREYVWEHNCDSKGQTFFLHRDGSVQCSGCHEFLNDLCWGDRKK